MSQKILNPSPQVVKAWQLVAGRINVICVSFPFGVVRFNGICYMNVLLTFQIFMPVKALSILTILISSLCRQMAPLFNYVYCLCIFLTLNTGDGISLFITPFKHFLPLMEPPF